MNTVKVKRDDLLKRIKKNRDSHRDLFLKAQEGYRKAVIEELDQMLKDARDNKRVRTVVELIAPEDHTKDYDRVIDMLEMSVDADITLASHDFIRYVRDEWEWSYSASMTNTAYASGGKLSSAK